MTWKRVLISVSVLLLVVVFASCGKSAKETGINNASGSDAKTDKGNEITAEVLSGDWYRQVNKNRITFQKDGTYTEIDKTGTSSSGGWSIRENKLVLSWLRESEWEFGEKNGHTILEKEDDKLVHWEDLPWQALSLNETANDGVVQFVLEQVRFTDTIEKPEEMEKTIWGILERDMDPLGDDMIYAKLDFHATNTGKTEVEFGDIDRRCELILNYNNGYLFSSWSNAAACFIMGNNFSIVKEYGTTSSGSITVQPLGTQSATVYIPCSKQVASDTESLHVQYFTTFGEDAQYFDYTIR